VDLDVTYEGTVCFTLETKLNLMKVKQMGGEIAAAQAAGVTEKEEILSMGKSKSPMYDSDLDDSAESSDDEDDDGKSTSGEERRRNEKVPGENMTNWKQPWRLKYTKKLALMSCG